MIAPKGGSRHESISLGKRTADHVAGFGGFAQRF
jgi:hypothetical protein